MDDNELDQELTKALVKKGTLRPGTSKGKHTKNSKSVRQLPKRTLDFDLLKKESVPRVKYIPGIKKNHATVNNPDNFGSNVLINSLLQQRASNQSRGQLSTLGGFIN